MHFRGTSFCLFVLAVVEGCGQITWARIPGHSRDILWNGTRNSDYMPTDGCHHHVALLVQPGYEKHSCSGVLVSSNWVLTDARCMDYRRIPSAMHHPDIHLGGNDMYGPFEEVHGIASVTFHPKYAGDVFSAYSFALVKLQEASRMTPVQLWEDDFSLKGMEIHAIGWGRIGRSGPMQNRLLRVGYLDLLPDQDCHLQDIPDEMDCFVTTSTHMCTGAGGFPIVASEPQSCKNHTLLGLARPGCIHQSKPQALIPLRNVASWVSTVAS